MDTLKKKRNVSLAKDEDGTDIKVKRHNLIVARASFPENTVLRGHTPEEIYDDGCKSQEIQSEIPALSRKTNAYEKMDVIICTCISKENYATIRKYK